MTTQTNKTISQILEELREKYFVNDGRIPVELIVELEVDLRSALERQKREIDNKWRERIKKFRFPWEDPCNEVIDAILEISERE